MVVSNSCPAQLGSKDGQGFPSSVKKLNLPLKLNTSVTDYCQGIPAVRIREAAGKKTKIAAFCSSRRVAGVNQQLSATEGSRSSPTIRTEGSDAETLKGQVCVICCRKTKRGWPPTNRF
jgi:predicted nucleotidyltransferase